MTRKLLCLGCAFILILLASCASKKDTAEDPVTLSPTAEQSAMALAAPKQQKKTFFEGIDESLLQKTQNATKSDLLSVLSQIKHQDDTYKENEQVLILLVQGVLSLMYNETAFSITIPQLSAENPYSAALDSAKKGAYDFSAGQSDFFTLVLPSLVLITAPSVQNYYEEASLSLQKGLELQADSFLALYLYALLLDRTNNKALSLQYLEKAYNKDSSYTPLAQLYMKSLYEAGMFDSSFKTAVSLLQISPGNIDALKICAQISFKNKDYDAAEQYVAQVLQREPDNTEYVLFRARILMDKGDYIRVSSLLDLYARNNKNGKEYLLLRTRLQRDWNKNTAAASNTIQEALVLYPADIDVLLLAASLSAQSGQKIGQFSLEDLLALILQQDSQNAEAIFLTVNENVRQQQWEQAYEYSVKIIERNTINEPVLLSHIEICIALGKLNEAETYLNQLSNTQADKELLAVLQIKLLIAEGNKDEAKRLIDIQISSTASSRSKSMLYYERSRIASGEDAKLSDLRSSLTSNPRNNEALYALYEFYFDKKDYRKAQYYLKQVVALSPSDQRLIKLNEEIEILLAN